eukprot:103555-Hanusia_phi.AAC.1
MPGAAGASDHCPRPPRRRPAPGVPGWNPGGLSHRRHDPVGRYGTLEIGSLLSQAGKLYPRGELPASALRLTQDLIRRIFRHSYQYYIKSGPAAWQVTPSRGE